METLEDRRKIKIDHHEPPAKILEQLMAKYNVSPSQLSSAVKCTRNHIHEILKGKCQPSYPLWTRILNYFGYRPSIAKMATAPRNPRKKKSDGDENHLEDSSDEPKVPEKTSSEIQPTDNGSAHQDKIKKLKELQSKVSGAKREDQ